MTDKPLVLEEDVERLRDSGMSIGRIALTLDCLPGHVRRVVRKIRDRKRYEIFDAEVIRLVIEGLDMREIAFELHVEIKKIFASMARMKKTGQLDHIHVKKHDGTYDDADSHLDRCDRLLDRLKLIHPDRTY